MVEAASAYLQADAASVVDCMSQRDGAALSAHDVHRVGGDEQLFVGGDYADLDAAVGRGDDALLTAVGFVDGGVDDDAHVLKPFESAAAHAMLVLAHTCGEDDVVHSAHDAGISADILADTVVVHFQSEVAAFVAGVVGGFNLAHVGETLGDAEHTRLLVEQIGDFLGAKTELILQEDDGRGVDVAGAGAHD